MGIDCNSLLLRRGSVHIPPPPRQLQRHLLQSLGSPVVIRRVVVRLAVVRPVRVRLPRPLLHREHVRRRVHLGLVVQPGRHVPDRHVVPVRVPVAGLADDGVHARRECYLRRAPLAEELRVQVHAFAVDLFDVLGRVRWVAGVEVPADAELVPRVELDLLAFEGDVDGFANVPLQAGHVSVLHPGHSGFPENFPVWSRRSGGRGCWFRLTIWETWWSPA